MRVDDIVKNSRIAIFAAHPDDIELAMGGTLNKIKNNRIWIDVFSDSMNVEGNTNIMDEFWSSMKIYDTVLQTTLWNDMNTMELYEKEKYIKSKMFYCKTHFKPDVVFCCNVNSDNSDHSVVGKCSINVFQEQTLLFYEDIHGGKKHRPDLYIKLDKKDINKKLEALRCYKSQNRRYYFKSTILSSFLRMRGSQSGVDFAESFEIYRLII